MSILSLGEAFVGFVTHYASEAEALHSALTAILGTLPIETSEKADIQNKLNALATAASNINAGLEALHNVKPEPIVIDEADVERAVTAVAGPLIEAAVAAAVAKLAGGDNAPS